MASNVVDSVRFRKAVALAERFNEWLKFRNADGKCIAVGVPSSMQNVFYRVTRSACECEDFKRRQEPCKHIMAVNIMVIRTGESQRIAA
jgi:hypothetical protein